MDSTMRTMTVLTFREFGKVVCVSHPPPVEDLLERSVILELDALTSAERTFLIEALLLWIHHYRLGQKKRGGFRHMLVIEEAHHILHRKKTEVTGKESITDMILREIRELGEGIVVIDQHPSLISIPSLANTNCSILLNLKHYEDVRTAADAILLDPKQRSALGELDVGEAVVRLQSRWFRPFSVRFPKAPVKAGKVDDEQVKTRMERDSTLFFSISPREPTKGGISASSGTGKELAEKPKKPLLSKEEQDLLLDVLQHPYSGVCGRYGRLGWTPHTGGILKQKLIEGGCLSSHPLRTHTGKTVLLQLTDRAKELLLSLGYALPYQGRGGLLHNYYRHSVAEYLRENGHRGVTEETRIGGGKCVDVTAYKEGKRIAFEIENGGHVEDALGNIHKCLDAGFDRVVSPCISRKLVHRLKECVPKGRPVHVLWIGDLLRHPHH